LGWLLGRNYSKLKPLDNSKHYVWNCFTQHICEMKQFLLYFLSYLYLLISPIQAQTVDGIINQYIDKVGGLKNWQKIINCYDSSLAYSVENIYTKETQPLKPVIIVNYVDKSGKFRTQFYSNNELETIRTYDKEYIYTYIYQNNIRFPLQKNMPIDGEKDRTISEVFKLLNAEKIEYAKRQMDDTLSYDILRVLEQNGEISLWYFDTISGLLVKMHIDEPQVRFVTYYQNYQKIDNVLMPMYQETRNSDGKVVMKIEKIIVKFNLKLSKHFYRLE
jgi:hypothetical protein